MTFFMHQPKKSTRNRENNFESSGNDVLSGDIANLGGIM